MKKYKKLYEMLTSAKVFCSLFAVLCILLWFYTFFELPYGNIINSFFTPATKLVSMFFNPIMHFQGKIANMTYLVVALSLYILYFVFLKAASLVKIMEKKYELSVIEERKIQERLVNEDLKQVFRNKTLQYNAFAILITLNLKHMIDPNNSAANLKEIAMKQYVHIVSIMRKKYPTCKAITPDKLFIIYNNFALFDDFLKDIMQEIKTMIEQNTICKIETSFTIAIDAMKEYDKIANILDLLEKITSFHYVNKAIATAAFNLRYNFNSNRKFKLSSMGISRFFEKSTPNNPKTGSADFELFSLSAIKDKH